VAVSGGDIEAPCTNLQGVLDPHGRTILF
jgi:hypothetical protein